MSDFSNSKIYRIYSPSTNEEYIGSTIMDLKTRMRNHRYCFLKWIQQHHYANYISSFDILKRGDAVIELIEEFPCVLKRELLERETHWIQHRDCVNKRTALTSSLEYRKSRRDQKKEYDKLYRKNNAERIKQKKREIYQRNKSS